MIRELYDCYEHINGRCKNKNNREYPRYGGRGIKNEWKSVSSFIADMGDAYTVHKNANPGIRNTQIDRIDNSGNYSKDNCRWVTAKENGRNKRNNRVFYLWGERYCLSEVCEILNLPYKNTWKRLYARGWSLEKVIVNS
jgi:hypothetical protein